MDVPIKFVKLMMLTMSENDGEALVALRKANAMLAAADVNWEEFLTLVGTENQKPQQPQQQSATPQRSSSSSKPPWEDDDDFADVGRDAKTGRYTDADTINKLFERAFAKTRRSSSGFREFLDSVHEFWERAGFLTEKQYHAVRRAALK